MIEGMHELPVHPKNYQLHKGLEMPLSLIVECEPRIAFQEPVTVLKVKVKVSNSKFGVPISVRLDFVNGDEAMRSMSDTNDPAFIWQGSQRVVIEELKPQEQEQFEQEIGFVERGVYDVCRIRVSIDSEWVKIEQKDYFSNESETILVDVY